MAFGRSFFTSVKARASGIHSRVRIVGGNLTDGKKTLGKATQTLITSVLITVLTLAISTFTARTLGAEGRGVVAALLLWPQLLGSFAGLGLSNAFVYYARKHPDHIPDLLGWTFVIVLLSTAAITVLGWLFIQHAAAEPELRILGNMMSGLSPSLVNFTLKFLWVAIPVSALAPFTAMLAQGLSEFTVFNGARLLLPIVQLTLMVFAWGMAWFDATVAAWCYVVASAIAIVWALWRFWKFHRPRFAGRTTYLSSYFKYGLGTYGIEVLAVFSGQIDKVFILAVLSLRELGIYSVAFGLSRVLGLLQNSVASVIFPTTANLPTATVVASVSQAARISLALSIVGGLPLLFFGGYILQLMFGHEFAQGGVVLQVLVVEVIISGTAWVLAQAFNSTGRPWLVAVRQASGIVAAVIGLSLLAPRYGAEGVAFALLIGASVRLITTLISFRLALGGTVPRLALTSADIKLAYKQLLQYTGKS